MEEAERKRRTEEERSLPEYNYFLAFNIGLETNAEHYGRRIQWFLSTIGDDAYSRRRWELRQDAFEILVHDAVYDPETDTYRRNAGGRQQEREWLEAYRENYVRTLLADHCPEGCPLLKDVLPALYREKPSFYESESEWKEDLQKEIQRRQIRVVDCQSSLPDLQRFLEAEPLLATLGKADLYDFLGTSPDVSKKAVDDALEALMKGYPGGAENGKEFLKLYVIARSCLAGSLEREKYDAYLAIRDTVLAECRDRYADGSISLKTYEDLLDRTEEATSFHRMFAEGLLAALLRCYRITLAAPAEGEATVAPGEETN